MDKLESLLESYYGMEDETVARDNAVDINSSSFDCAQYVSDLLAVRTLPELMAQQNTLVSETRALDRDMQDLVYNNYNKFISATDTIRTMRESVGEMETAMNRLVTDMKQMGGSSAIVNENLQENRGKIEKLVGVKRLLIKLEFLFELPLRLKRAMELDALSQAVRYYTMVSGVLTKYGRIPSIHAIRLEADAIMDKLKEQLRNTLKSKKDGVGVSTVSSSKVVEAIRLLAALGEPRAGLRAAYLQFQRGRLLSGLHGFANKHMPNTSSTGTVTSSSSVSNVASSSSFSTESSTLLSDRAKGFYTQAQIAAAANVASPDTIAPSRPRATIGAHAFMQGCNRTFLDGFRYGTELYVELFEDGAGKTTNADGTASSSSTVSQEDIDNERRIAHEELLAFTKDVFAEYFSTLKRQLSLSPMVEEEVDTPNDANTKKGKGKNKRSNDDDNTPMSPGPRGAEDDDAAEAEELKAAALAAAGFVAGKDGSPAGRYGQITSALQLLLQDIRGASRNVREAQLVDRAHEVTEAILRAQLDGLFADVRSNVVRLLADLQVRAHKIFEEARDKAASNSDENSDWVATVGSALSFVAEEASNQVSTYVDEALIEAKPLVLAGIRLLPALASIFSSLVHGQVLSVLSWLAAAWEACSSGAHPCRAEFHSIVVEADLALEKERENSRRRPNAGNNNANNKGTTKASMQRRSTVYFAHAEADQSAPVLPSSVAYSTILSPETHRHHVFLLLLAVLCRHYAQHGVARALSTMINTLPTRNDLQAMGLTSGDEMESYGSMMDVPDLIRRVQAAGCELLRQFASLHATRLSAVIRKAMTTSDWLATKEPRDTRLVIKIILEDIAAQKRLVAATLGEWDSQSAALLASTLGSAPTTTNTDNLVPSRGLPTNNQTSGSTAKRTGIVVCAAGMINNGPASSISTLGMGNGGANGRGMPLDFERVFRNPSDNNNSSLIVSQGSLRNILGIADYNAASVARLILRVILKTLIEWIRLTTFSKGGYQQIQADLASLHVVLPYFTSNYGSNSSTASVQSADPYAYASVLEELLHEAAVSAGERCVEPVAIEPSVAYNIAVTFISTINLPQAWP